MRLLPGLVALQAVHVDAAIKVELELCTDKNSESQVRKYAESVHRIGLISTW